MVEVGILLEIALVLTSLGRLPPLRDLFKVLLLEDNRQLVEAEAGVEVTLLAAKAQRANQSRVVHQPGCTPCARGMKLRHQMLWLVLSPSLVEMYMCCLTLVLHILTLVPVLHVMLPFLARKWIMMC